MIKSRIKQERDVTEYIADIGSSEFKIRFPLMGARSAHALFNTINEMIELVQKQARLDVANEIGRSLISNYVPSAQVQDNIVRTLVLTPHIDVEDFADLQTIHIKAGTYRAYVDTAHWTGLEKMKSDMEINGVVLCDGIVKSEDGYHYFVE